MSNLQEQLNELSIKYNQPMNETNYENGMMLINGPISCTKNAIKSFTVAAEQGYAVAQFNLGLMYDQGKGVAQDYSAAMKWYQKAADQGYAYAQCSLGDMYDLGKGVDQSDATAVKW